MIKFNGDIHEFSMDTAYFIVTPREFFYVSETERHAREWMNMLPTRIREELSKIGGGIIWWRIHTEIDHAKIGCNVEIDPRFWTEEDKRIGEQRFGWVGYARFATSPELPEEVIARFGFGRDEYNEKCAALREKAIAALKV